MIVALIDNGSLEPAAHRNLRAVAAALAKVTGTAVHPVSWKHSDRIDAAALDGPPAWTLAPFVRAMHALGQREFIFVPFFISPQGAIGSALRADLERRQTELGGFDFAFTHGLADSETIPSIVAARIRETLTARPPARLPVVLVDHGGPSAASATLRDRLADRVRALLGHEIASVTPASMEGAHPPLLGDILRTPGFAASDVIVAPLFLSPGRHAGPEGDIARICADSPARCHVAALVGTHPLAIDALAVALREYLSTLPVPISA
ncbi:MAG: CbiX/SirB N-terminal domain-containing protein [Opitutaceae bacterium]|nr:CbiX/SirB N-terminal domain-containing protein [Opitutaceae bacterium]